MVAPYQCPGCGANADGERCARCGLQLLVPAGSPDMLSVAAPGLRLEELARRGGGEAGGRRTAAAYLALEPSETAVLHAASRILAGFIAAGAVTAENEKEMSDRAVKLATRMALVVERYIQSDTEDW